MVSFGVIDLLLILILILAFYFGSRRRTTGLFIVLVAIFLIILTERLAPGSLAALGNAIHQIDAINAAGPHLTIAPIITFR